MNHPYKLLFEFHCVIFLCDFLKIGHTIVGGYTTDWW